MAIDREALLEAMGDACPQDWYTIWDADEVGKVIAPYLDVVDAASAMVRLSGERSNIYLWEPFDTLEETLRALGKVTAGGSP